MKGQLEGDHVDLPEMEPLSEQDWTEEMLRKRSEELQLIDCQGNITYPIETKGSESHVEDLVLSDHDISPSKSTTTESQVPSTFYIFVSIVKLFYLQAGYC